MTTKPPETARQLRQRAEEQLRADDTATAETPTPGETRILLHELRVHQIELEMQNEELRKKQSELDTERARYFDLYDLAPMGYLTFNAQGLICEANLLAATMLGVTRKVLFNNLMAQFIFPEDQDVYYLNRKRLLETGVVQAWEMRLMRADGSVFWAHLQATLQHDGEYWIVFNDISERKQMENELQRKSAEIEQFIYTVSHDLRSPLVTVKTFMGYLEKDMAEGNREQLAQDVKFIHGAADKMKLLLDELLEFSRIGRIEAQPEEVSLGELLNDVVDSLAGAISERAVEIHLPDTELILFGSRLRLHQLWQNLLENAIKYSRQDVSPRIELGWQQENGETVFFVRDNGIGVVPVYHSKIFGIFEKLDPASPGAGLGLSMVQRIVEKNGGRVWVESEGKGMGSTFRFTLPLATDTHGLRLDGTP